MTKRKRQMAIVYDNAKDGQVVKEMFRSRAASPQRSAARENPTELTAINQLPGPKAAGDVASNLAPDVSGSLDRIADARTIPPMQWPPQRQCHRELVMLQIVATCCAGDS